MPGSIDWYYRSPNCNTCKRADALLAEQGMTARETENAARRRYTPDEAIELLAPLRRVVVARGTKVVTFDLGQTRPDDPALLELIIGRSGYLRAPAMRRGRTLLIGLNEVEFTPLLTGDESA